MTHPKSDIRVIAPFSSEASSYKKNVVKNSKYTLLNFLPKNLKEQFSYALNVYFLFVSVMQFIKVISPVNPLSTLLPLVFAFLLSACKEAADDYSRAREDRTFNNRMFQKITRDGRECLIQSKKIHVGDIIRVNCNEDIPADMILLRSSNENGICQIQTDKIDGETRLKGREVVHALLTNTQDLAEILGKIRVTCPSPFYRHHAFEGLLAFGSHEYALSEINFLPQASSLRATQWVYGIVIYTGDDTVCFWNKRPPSLKRAQIDFQINRYSIGIFIFQICIVLGFGITGSFFALRPATSASFTDWIIIPARFFLLMAIMIPISFKVAIDVSKYVTSRFIVWDEAMGDRHASPPRRISVSNSSIAEDLACVKYILTDKTGTLTENKMKLRGLCAPGAVLEVDDLFESGPPSSKVVAKPLPDSIVALFEHMLLCHSVFTDENIIESLASPEELCMLQACAQYGFHLRHRRRDGSCLISTPAGDFQYKILEEFIFTSERRRMSVLVFDQTRQCHRLLIKGAEEEIFQRLENPAERTSLKEAIDQFSANALRVLAMGAREVSHSELEKYTNAKNKPYTSLHERHAHLRALWDGMERGLHLVGACGIGDNLQPKVAETIESLRDGAGIHFWMLTGDKQQTAWEVAKLSRIVQSDTEFTNIATYADFQLFSKTPKAQNLCVHGGDVLKEILAQNAKEFMQMAMAAQAVVIYRISAEQKAIVARLVKQRTPSHLVTLAIGDGGNDVAMIQAADVGVGIQGQEGAYAARAADFAVTQFADIARLLLVHGHYCHRRTSYIILYSFYKSMLVSFAQLVFNPLVQLRGVSFWDSMQLTMWNGLHTMPIVFAAVFDRAAPQDGLMANPSLYKAVRDGKWFNVRLFIGYLMKGQLQACLLIFGCMFIFDLDAPTRNSLAYALALALQIVAIFFESYVFTVVHLLAVGATVGMYILTTAFHHVFVPDFSVMRLLALTSDTRLYALLSVVLLPSIWVQCMLRIWADEELIETAALHREESASSRLLLKK